MAKQKQQQTVPDLDQALVAQARLERLAREAGLRRLKYNNRTWYDITPSGRGDPRPEPPRSDPRRDPSRRDPASVAGLGHTDREIRVTPWEWISEADKHAHAERRKAFERDVRDNARTPFNPDWRVAAGVDAGNGCYTRRPSPCQPFLTPGVPRVNPSVEKGVERRPLRAALAWEAGK